MSSKASRGIGSILQHLQISESMKVVQQSGPGGPESLVVDPIYLRPEPKDKEILIEVAYSAVNRLDILQRKGSLPVPKNASPILGLEVTGTVYKLGPKCSGKWKEGDRVMALVNGGGYAEYATVNEDHVMAIPEDMSFKKAAAIPEVWLTAYQLLHMIAKVSRGDIVLIHAGGSGVGTAAVQLAAMAGAKPIVTAGSQEKIDKAIKLGAVAGINYKKEEFDVKIYELTKGKGANIILDCIGSSYWAKNLEALAMDGKWVLYGLLGGPNVKGNILGGLLKKRATLSATTLRTRSDEYKADLVEQFTKNVLPMFSRTGKTKLKAVVDRVFHLDDIQEAHRYVELNKNIGKVLLQVKPSENEPALEEDRDESVVTQSGHGEL